MEEQGTETPPEATATPPPPAEPKGRTGGPRADRLEQARAAHQAATQPKPKRSPRPSRDSFEEEEP